MLTPRAFASRHKVELLLAAGGMALAIGLEPASQRWADAFLAAVVAGVLVSMALTEADFQRRRARQVRAHHRTVEAARIEVLEAPLRTLPREVYDNYDPGPPETITSLATAATNVVGFGTLHEERFAAITESLRERYDAFVGAVAPYLLDLDDSAREAAGDILRDLQRAAAASWTLERLHAETARREARNPEDPLKSFAAADPVRKMIQATHRAYREALSNVVDACERLRRA